MMSSEGTNKKGNGVYMQILQETEYFILSKRVREIRPVYLLYQAVSTYNIFLIRCVANIHFRVCSCIGPLFSYHELSY
jgi:hypothetical protein